MTEKGTLKEKQSTSSYKYGYIVRNMNILSKRCVCEFCTLILRDPMQLTECGHRLCKPCIELQGDSFICSGCQEKRLKNEVIPDRGFKRELDFLSIECRWCLWKGILKNYQDHLDEQHPQVICDQCKAEFDSIYSLKHHTLNECPKNVFAHNLVTDFDWLNTFIQQSIEIHINENYRNILVHSVHSDSSESPRKKTKNDAAIPRINDDNDEAKKVNLTVRISPDETSATNHEPKCHSNEIIHLQNFSESCTQEVQTMKTSIQQLIDLYTKLQHKQQDIQQQLTLVHQNPDQREFTTYNGILLWKMTNVQTKMNVQSQVTPWVDSDPFYTSSAGYKVRLRVYLNGADDALGTHMSIFFILMRGDYDAGLNFPFNYKVSICLFDQTPQQRHVIKSIRPKGSVSFQRPQTEMNIPHKILKFCSLETLLQAGSPYIQGDSILIKVMVNTGDIMRSILPYAFSLESGLPADVQRAMIRKKQEKRDQLRLARTAVTTQNDLELSQATQNLTRPSIEPRQRRQSSSSTSGSRGMSPLDQQDDGTLDS